MLWYFCWNIQFGFIIENWTLLQYLGQAWIAGFQKSQKLVVGCLDVIVGDDNVKVAFACSIPGFDIGHTVLKISLNRRVFFILIDIIDKESDDSGAYEWDERFPFISAAPWPKMIFVFDWFDKDISILKW